jgi:hypothetical protein
MPRAQLHIALVLDLRGAFVVGLVESELRPAFELTCTIAVPIR